jgi:class 3 adenylate cyclase
VSFSGQVHDALMRPDLPRGTVTFLFTDVEGSTRLLSRLGPELYAEALAAHRQTLRDAFAAEGGVGVDTQRDAFFVAFQTASGAAIAARSGQTPLTSGRSPSEAAFSVRKIRTLTAYPSRAERMVTSAMIAAEP